MKKLIFLFIFLVAQILCYAQADISLSELSKIKIDDSGGGLGGGFRVSYEIIKEADIWQCYRTHLWSSYSYALPVDRIWLAEESMKPGKLIRKVETETLENFLNAIKRIKPVFDWKDLDISANTLIANDTARQKNSYLKKWGKRVEPYYTEENIQSVVEDLQKGEWTDDGPFCKMVLFTKRGDSVEVSSHRQVDFMLPWKVNGTDSFDATISRFMASIIEKHALASNGDRLIGTNLPYNIQNDIYLKYAWENIVRENWYTLNPENLSLLKSNFDITEPVFQDEEGLCELRHTAFPPQFSIKSTINIAKRENIESLIRYRDSIIQFNKKGNFVFKYYKDKPGVQIVFPRYTYNHSKSYFVDELVHGRLPTLKGYDLSKALYFEVLNNNYTNYESRWLLLPDNKIVLIGYEGNEAAGISENLLPPAYNRHLFWRYDIVLLLLDAEGKLIQRSK